MPIHLKNISLRKLGPIESLSLDLGLVNLIYGPNEAGKTFLVEFLLQALFRGSRDWPLRDHSGQGSITLEGLPEGLVSFAPATPKKLEDYWDEEELGLPRNMARLLVVKGGELPLSAAAPGGVNRAILKSVLTRETLLEEIRSRIQITVQKSSLRDGAISPKENKGLLKQRSEALENRDRVAALLLEIESTYSRGPVRALELQIAETAAALEGQQEAKRHQAYLLEQEKLALEQASRDLPESQLQALGEKLTQHQLLAQEADQLGIKLDQNKDRSRDFAWLKEAVAIWEAFQLEGSRQPSPLLLLGGAALLLLGLAFPLLPALGLDPSWPWLNIPLGIAGLGLVGLYVLLLQKWSQRSSQSEERQQIEKEFLARFDQPLPNLASLKEKYTLQQEFSILAANQEHELEDLAARSERLAGDILGIFSTLRDRNVPPADWNPTHKELQRKKNDLDGAARDLDKKLALLGVEGEDYRADPSPDPYQPERLAELASILAGLKAGLADQESILAGLKRDACRETGADLTAPWQEVFTSLRDLKISLDDSCRELEAKIIAGIGLSEVIQAIEGQEDQKIQRDLNAPEVSRLLTSLTGSYSTLELVEDRLYASGPYARFPLEDLSTGAREQVHLALRMGIASKISGGEPLFLILDDAFQHSDWNRRESLVEGVLNLAGQGWQILYLSMDDHIRDLFLKKGKEKFKKDFRPFQIS